MMQQNTILDKWSKAWKNDIHYEQHKNNFNFYYDRQGFKSVQLKYDKAKTIFYEILGKALHGIEAVQIIRNINRLYDVTQK